MALSNAGFSAKNPLEATMRHVSTAGPFALPDLARLRARLAAWEARLRFRRDLARKTAETPHLIADIGLTRAAVEAEIAKPFWRV